MPRPRPSPEQLLAHSDFVRGLARGLLRDPHLAEDVAQDTLAAALERPPDSALHLRAWLARVARNFAFQRLRADARRRARELATVGPATVSVDELAQREATRAVLVRALLGLPEPMRDALVLRFEEGLPPRAIARRLGLPVETVRTRIKRGLARLRSELEGSDELGADGWTRALLPLAAAPGLSSGAGGAAVVLGAGLWPKLATAVVVVALGLVAWRALDGAPGPDAPAEGVGPTALADEGPGELELAAAAAGQRSPAGAAEASARVVGRVVDPRGRPAAGALVYAASSGPLDDDLLRPGSRSSRRGDDDPPVWGRSDELGRFELALPEPGRTYVDVALSPEAELLPPLEGRWVEAPAEEVELVLVDAPLAGVVVRAHVAATGQALRDFPVAFHSSVTKTYLHRRAVGAELACQLPLGRAAEPAVFGVLIEVDGLTPWSGHVRLEAGSWAEVDAALEGGTRVRGRVVDPAGAPVADALVCYGLQERLRGDEPFKPFDSSRVRDGARTDADGRFELVGSGERLTAWHADFGAATVESEPFARADDERIELPAPGALRGRVLDRAGRPREQVLVVCDRSETRVTDAAGRFAFERVPPGVRGLMLQPPVAPDGSSERPWYVGVQVAAGEHVELELGAERLDALLEVELGDAPPLGKGLLLGLDALASFHELDLASGWAEVAGALPGRYLLLDASGPRAFLTLDGPFAPVRSGEAELTVVGPPGTRVFLAPPEGNELVDLLAARFAARPVPADGELVFAGLPEGTWAVAARGRGRLVSVLVTGRGTRVELP